jgi:hypothetical protein
MSGGRVRQVSLTRTGLPDHDRALDVAQRGFDQMGKDINDLSASSGTYSATAANWATPAPTTKDEALTRLAAAVAGLLGTPIP